MSELHDLVAKWQKAKAVMDDPDRQVSRNGTLLDEDMAAFEIAYYVAEHLDELDPLPSTTVDRHLRKSIAFSQAEINKLIDLADGGALIWEISFDGMSITPKPAPFKVGQRIRLKQMHNTSFYEGLYGKIFVVEKIVWRDGRSFAQARFGEGPNDYVDLLAEAFEVAE